jgi:hypothetical protein
MRRRVTRIALAITAVVVVAIAGGVTYAVAQIGSGGLLHGCYTSANGQLRLIDPATDSCHPSDRKGHKDPRVHQASGRRRSAASSASEAPRCSARASPCAEPQWATTH